VEHHGSESYFVVGEGLLAESVGGRERTLSAGLEALAPPFRFSRMGPNGIQHQLGEPNLKKIANAMTASGVGASQIPSGFTYLGQFTDHDLTFDKTKVMLGENVSPAQLLQARSPSLDLDSLYGAGPADPVSAKFYAADGLHLKVGKTLAAEGITAKQGFDLPRGAGTTVAKKRKAIIPDPRNDENLAVAQTHLAMIRFHNRVVDTLGAVPLAQRFDKAREIVTKHYQWMLRTDYLPRICAPGVVNNVFTNGRKAFEVGVPPTDVPTMPIEFSVAAFRLGHSMIRRAYNWNKIFDDGFGSLDLLFVFSATGGDLGSGPRLPSTWIADFRRLYDFKEAGRADLAVPESKFNRAMRIDTRLVNPLKNLPAGSFGGPAVPFNDPRANLAFRNLTRAKMVRLATGQQMAKFLQTKGVTLTKLTQAQIRDGKNGADFDALTQPQRAALLKDTPLWFYILREADVVGDGDRLGPVGGRIVGEVLVGLLNADPESFRATDPGWRPTLPAADREHYSLADLLAIGDSTTGDT